MSDPTLVHTLTADRLEDLRLIATGATRRKDGSLFVLQRQREAWLEREGYLVPRAPMPPTNGRPRPRPRAVLTAKGWEAVGEGDRVRGEALP